MIEPEWQESKAYTLLSDHETHVWRVELNSLTELDAFRQVLAADEWTRAPRFSLFVDYQRYIVGRGILRILLGHYLDMEAQAIRFAFNHKGKPSLIHSAELPPLFFNLSHSGDLILLAFTRLSEIGIDVEQIASKQGEDDLARMILSERELSVFRSHPQADRTALFFRYWTCKEAVVKSFGGSIDDVRGVELPVDLPPLSPPPLWRTAGGRAVQVPRFVLEFTPRLNYAAALSMKQIDSEIRYWRYEFGANF